MEFHSRQTMRCKPRFDRGAILVAILMGWICFGGTVHSSPREDPVADWDLDLSWDTSQSETDVKTASPGDPLNLVCRLSGADSLQGFQVLLRIRAVGNHSMGSWSFRDSSGCAAATFEVDSRGDAGAAAPWIKKLVMSDLRYGEETGAAVIVVAGAFDRAVLDPDSSYVLCNIHLVPPDTSPDDHAGRECAGWDSPAIFDLVAAKVLLPDGRQVPLEVPRKCLALRLTGPG